MRRLAIMFVLIALAVAIQASASGPAYTPSVTQRVVIRPVTSAGVPAAGFHVVTDDDRGDAVDCSVPDSSPGAVSPDIEWCSPSAAYAVACWKASTAHRVLCSRDPTSQRVYSLWHTGKFATTRPVNKRDRAPIVLILRDGTTCFIRDGGAWGQLKSHPKWYGTYSCDHHGDVWSRPSAPHDGVDESQPTWTVHTSPASGSGRVTVRSVRTAYFVGTATGG